MSINSFKQSFHNRFTQHTAKNNPIDAETKKRLLSEGLTKKEINALDSTTFENFSNQSSANNNKLLGNIPSPRLTKSTNTRSLVQNKDSTKQKLTPDERKIVRGTIEKSGLTQKAKQELLTAFDKYGGTFNRSELLKGLEDFKKIPGNFTPNAIDDIVGYDKIKQSILGPSKTSTSTPAKTVEGEKLSPSEKTKVIESVQKANLPSDVSRAILEGLEKLSGTLSKDELSDKLFEYQELLENQIAGFYQNTKKAALFRLKMGNTFNYIHRSILGLPTKQFHPSNQTEKTPYQEQSTFFNAIGTKQLYAPFPPK